MCRMEMTPGYDRDLCLSRGACASLLPPLGNTLLEHKHRGGMLVGSSPHETAQDVSTVRLGVKLACFRVAVEPLACIGGLSSVGTLWEKSRQLSVLFGP